MENKNINTTQELEELRLPSSYEQEAQIIADLIANPNMVITARGIINQDMFTNSDLKKAWIAINEMIDQGTAVDLATITLKVGPQILSPITERTAAFGKSVIDHCGALHEIATRRLLFSRSYEMMHSSIDHSLEMADLLSQPGKLADELADKTNIGAGSMTLTDVLNEYANDLGEQQKGKTVRIPTGFHRLNNALYGGWSNGSLIVLAARPSVGKSALMLQMALEAAKAGFIPSIYSLEMPSLDLGRRYILSTGELRYEDIKSPQAIKNLDFDKIEQAIKHFDKIGHSIYINTKLRRLDDICNDITLQHHRKRCDIAFIDHLQIISKSGSRATLYQAITEMTRRLKLLAMDCNIPIVLLCQLNRSSETESRAPELRDLRDSGSIEQDADVVLMLCRQTLTLTDPRIDIWVRKNRNGIAGGCITLEGDISRGFNTFREESYIKKPQPEKSMFK